MCKNCKKVILLLSLIIPAIFCWQVQDESVPPAATSFINIKGSAALDNFPLIDGHNDLPYILVVNYRNQLKNLNLYNLTNALECNACKHTDINKLKIGKVGAQFWSAFVLCKSQFVDAVEHTLEQIDVIRRFVKSYSKDFEFVTTADGILQAFNRRKIGSLIGVEGGHSIANKLSILRTYYELGARYMTLTHTCHTPWADASPIDTQSINNITEFGKKIVLEMNRLGMLVDISHVSHGTMVNVLKISKAPIIFSHSNAYTINPHHRNVRDDVLQMLKKNKGIIMVTFHSIFVGQGNATIATVARHIEYIVDVCGIQCVGIGGDFSGMNKAAEGLEDVSKYPYLFDFLRESNPSRWTIRNLEKLAGRNLIRVFKEVEKVRDSLMNEEPYEDWIPAEDLEKLPEETKRCRTDPTDIS